MMAERCTLSEVPVFLALAALVGGAFLLLVGSGAKPAGAGLPAAVAILVLAPLSVAIPAPGAPPVRGALHR